jgi:hypothetical protein
VAGCEEALHDAVDHLRLVGRPHRERTTDPRELRRPNLARVGTEGVEQTGGK